MEQLQFCAVVLMSLLTLTLVFLLPSRMAKNPVARRASLLMAAGSCLLALQFLLQYTLHLRSLGVTQAVVINLLFFIPCSFLFCLGELYLQRQGNIKKHEWWIGIAAWVIVAAIVLTSPLISHSPLLSDTSEMRIAVIVGSIVYAFMQCYYSFLHYRELRRLRNALSNYYDNDQSNLLHWMRSSMLFMVLLPIFVPLFIFGPQWLLFVYGLTVFAGIYSLVISFVCYIVSNDAAKVMEAEQPEQPKTTDEKTEPACDDADNQRVESAINRWISNKGHLKNGITIQNVADELKLPRYQLNSWLKNTRQESFSAWLASLRIEEAKRLMTAHPDWSNDVIAEQCGFSSRSYFQTVFHKLTGMTPAKFLEESSSLK